MGSSLGETYPHGRWPVAKVEDLSVCLDDVSLGDSALSFVKWG